jgi:hypothetical protein
MPVAVRLEATAVANAPAMPNPALRLDPVLGLVVLQFRDAQGEVVSTLPTERELAAYRNAGKRAASAATAPAEERAGPWPADGATPATAPTTVPPATGVPATGTPVPEAAAPAGASPPPAAMAPAAAPLRPATPAARLG